MCKIYGYCRISRKEQNIERQIRNIKAEYADAIIIQEAFTGTKIEGRKEFEKIIAAVRENDTIVFDSVSRMSRNAEEGTKIYFELLERGINLVFLKEHYIDTDVYKSNTIDKIALIGTDEDEIFKGINNYFRKLAERQIRIAFEQAQKEVDDLHQRTAEGLATARLAGKQIGGVAGKKLNVKKAVIAKEMIKKYSRDFDGSLSDIDLIAMMKTKLGTLAMNTYYKYKAELRNEQ